MYLCAAMPNLECKISIKTEFNSFVDSMNVFIMGINNH